jgi:hypothetical protein
MKITEDERILTPITKQTSLSFPPKSINNIPTKEWDGHQRGFDWQLEQARRVLEGPSFAPLRMTLWNPIYRIENTSSKPNLLDTIKILIYNFLEQMKITKSLEGVPIVQGVNTFKGNALLHI